MVNSTNDSEHVDQLISTEFQLKFRVILLFIWTRYFVSDEYYIRNDIQIRKCELDWMGMNREVKLSLYCLFVHILHMGGVIRYSVHLWLIWFVTMVHVLEKIFYSPNIFGKVSCGPLNALILSLPISAKSLPYSEKLLTGIFLGSTSNTMLNEESLSDLSNESSLNRAFKFIHCLRRKNCLD